MRRYASIDFLRGFAIFLMVYLHTFMRWFDIDGFVANIGDAPLSLLLLLVISLFLGSWAGFFLMVSAMGNMVSMYKGLAKGQNVKGLVQKQIIGGFLLLIFAYLSEGLIGYHGTLGEIAIGNLSALDTWLWRGYHMETIHTIAWCIILNGIVQGILSKNGGWEKITRNIKIYAILAIIMIVLTPLVWIGFDAIVPNGDYSHGLNPLTGHPWQYGHLTQLDFVTNVIRAVLQPWAGQVEPIFPFLAVSFIGSIIALYLMKREKEPKSIDTTQLKKGMKIGFVMFIGGLLLVLVGLLLASGDIFDNILGLLRRAYDVTDVEGNFGWLWLPYFIMVTGAQIAAILLIFRMVEFRGKSEQFAKKTLFFRRFGFVAFSIYNYQMLDVLAIIPLMLLFGMPSAGNAFNPVTIWFALILIFVVWQVVLKLWEKVNYAFGLEWCIAKISTVIIPIRRQEADKKLPWWKTSRLDPQTSLYEAEWINIIADSEIDHVNLRESKLAYKIALGGIIFFPLFGIAVILAKGAVKAEQENKYNKRAKLIGLIGTIIWIILIILLSILTAGILF